MNTNRAIRLGAAVSAAATVGMAALAAVSGRGEPRVSLHRMDLGEWGGPAEPRTWRGPGHLLHHLRELAALGLPLTEVYLAGAISPAFRERIMLVTAMANRCDW